VSDDHAPSVGPVMAFTSRREEVVRFYTEIAGLKAELQGGATWLETENAQVVVHDPDDRQTEAEVRAQRGFVVWFGIDDVPGRLLLRSRPRWSLRRLPRESGAWTRTWSRPLSR